MAGTLRQRLTALLVQNHVLTQAKLDEAIRIQKEKKERIGDILVNLGYISRENLLEVMSAELGIPAVHLSRYKVQPEVLSLVPKKIAGHYCLVPLSLVGSVLTIAMSDPMNVHAVDDVKRLTGFEVRSLLASEKEVKEAIEQYYGENVSQAIQDVMKNMDSEESLEVQEGGVMSAEAGTAQDLLRLTEDEPIVKLTNSIMVEGVKRRSSDIFVEPEEKILRVRFRVDGMLQEGISTAKSMHAGVVSRIKVISNLDIAEHRVPQDGRFKLKIHDKFVDFRVSVLPSYFGEKVVLRVLDKNAAMLDIEKLGFEPSPLAALKSRLGLKKE